MTAAKMTGLLPCGAHMIRGRGGSSSEHDRGRRRPDHGRAQRSRIAPRLRSPNRGRPHRTDHGRHHQAACRARAHHHQRPPAAKRGHSNARHADPPHPNPPHPHRRRPNPPQPNARPPSPHRTTHRIPHLGPLHRVMDRCRRLAPEVVRSHRTWNDPGGRGRGSVTPIRRPRAERNQILAAARTSLAGSGRRSRSRRLPACLVWGPFFFHRFADLFPVGRGIRVLPAR